MISGMSVKFSIFLIVGWLSVLNLLASDCNSARDLLSSGLERMGRGELQEALQLFKRATGQCSTLGDAWYYASLCARELGDHKYADYYRKKAEEYGSDALKRGENPRAAATNAGIKHPAAPEIRIPPYIRQKLALVVGIGKFKDPRINALRFTTNDARAFAETLTSVCKFDYVKLLVDEEATTTNIKTEVDRIAKMANPEDLVVIYISSHGSPENLDAAGVNYIVTHDTEVDKIYGTGYKMDELLDDNIRKRIKAERVVAFLDACYSGGTFRELPAGWAVSSRALVTVFGPRAELLESRLRYGERNVRIEPVSADSKKVPQGAGRVIITSSSQNEQSWEDERIRHGYFTYYLIEAIRQKSPISIEEIYSYLKTKVPEAVRRDKGKEQHPNIAKSRDKVEIYLRDELIEKGAPSAKSRRKKA